MAWSVDNIYSFVKFLVRKNQAGGVSATDLFYVWNSEQTMYHQDIVGRWQARANGKQGANTGLIVNEAILGELSPFTIPVTLTIASGKSDKPDDFIYRLSLRINDAKVQFVRHDQISEVNKSVIDPPNIANNCYYAVEYEDYYSFLPNTVTSAELDYIASCTDIVWGYTLDVDERQVYSAGTSVQPQWSQNTIVEITKRALVNLGVSFKDQDFSNFGKSAQVTGD